MLRFRLTDLKPTSPEGHVFDWALEGRRLYHGGLSFHPPGMVTHDEQRPHLEVDQELFCLLQGEGWIEIGGVREPVVAGDVILIEPGEDHHLVSSDHNPLINLWLHADESGNRKQFPES